MKRNLFVGMLVMGMVLGFAVVGCASGPGPNLGVFDPSVPAVQAQDAVVSQGIRRTVVSFNALGNEFAEELSYVTLEWSKSQKEEGENRILTINLFFKDGRTGSIKLVDGSEGEEGIMWNLSSVAWSTLELSGTAIWIRDSADVPATEVFNMVLLGKGENDPTVLTVYSASDDVEGGIYIKLDGSFFAN
jgi:hypothetical protein